jgi:predicted RNA-binding Zn-ribbon protein involved in translation (DUF1610 family)
VKRKDTVAWECPACGQRHLWRWEKGEAALSSNGNIHMGCTKCGSEFFTRLIRIGLNAWAAIW